MNRSAVVAALLLLGHVAANAALAGVADTPLPVLEAGKTTYHVYSVPGVIQTLSLGTFFSCTSLEKTATMRVGVEAFAGPGGLPVNDAVATSLAIQPGGTVTFGTNTAVGFSVTSDLGIFQTQGSARILSTSKKLMCTAYRADYANSPPTSMVQLTIIAKTKQKAAN
jgi:hypothetical protein